MIDDLKLIFEFFLNLCDSVWDLIIGSILVFSVVLCVISWVVKLMKVFINGSKSN